MANVGETGTLLACSAGFAAIARDGVLGTVETPLFPPDAREPDFLVIRAGPWPRTRRTICGRRAHPTFMCTPSEGVTR